MQLLCVIAFWGLWAGVAHATALHANDERMLMEEEEYCVSGFVME
jgi:hypothetical protein